MNEPAAESPPAPTSVLVGARWALGLGLTLLVAMALVNVSRRLESPAATLEKAVQVPVPNTVATPTPAVLAPDPGDNP